MTPRRQAPDLVDGVAELLQICPGEPAEVVGVHHPVALASDQGAGKVTLFSTGQTSALGRPAAGRSRGCEDILC